MGRAEEFDGVIVACSCTIIITIHISFEPLWKNSFYFLLTVSNIYIFVLSSLQDELVHIVERS